MRAAQPTASGALRRDGVEIAWETFGEGQTPILLLPTWSIIPSRFWKLQVPYLARHHRVITFDGRGTGRSDRPIGPDAYTADQFSEDAVAVLDAVGIDRAVVVGFSRGALWGVRLASDHPQRVAGLIAIGPSVPTAPRPPERSVFPFDVPQDSYEGWGTYNEFYWKEDLEGFVRFFFGELFSEPHSTKQIEDCVGWALDIDPARLADSSRGAEAWGPRSFRAACEQISCPVLVVHGDEVRSCRTKRALLSPRQRARGSSRLPAVAMRRTLEIRCSSTA